MQAISKIHVVLESKFHGELCEIDWFEFRLNDLKIALFEKYKSLICKIKSTESKLFSKQATSKTLDTLKSNGHGELWHWVWFDLNHSLAI